MLHPRSCNLCRSLRTPLSLVFLFFSLLLPGLSAQTGDGGATPTVSEVSVEFLTLQNVSLEAIMAHLQVREGLPYNQNLVDRSVRSLYQTGLFDFIEVRTENLPGNQVRLVFVLQPKYRIQQILFVGNQKYSVRRLLSKTEARGGNVLDERIIRKDRDAVLKYYREKGFTQALVEYDIQREPSSGQATVTYRITEGPRLKIKQVNFIGNEAFSQRRLRGEMETKRRWMFSWLTGSGRFDEVKLQEDLDKLREFYAKNGYLDIHIAEADVVLDYPTDKTIAITIRVTEGRQYRMGQISFEGNALFPSDLLGRVVRMVPGDVFSPEKLDEDLGFLSDFYGASGYLETNIRAERMPNLATGDIDVRYVVSESERFFVESIKIEGNTKTKTTVILRELALQPGAVFNTIWMKNSEARLKNTRFFDEVTLAPETTNLPGRRNLKVQVKEARTGQFQFGAGFSSVERAVVFFELTQGNFDLFNYRSFFQGDGQKFRFRLALGSRSNEVVIGFEEPWFMEQRLALGVELYRRETNYNSAAFNEIRTGMEVYLRRRLFELVDGQLSYRLENIELKDVLVFAPIEIINEEGSRLASKVALTLVRDTRDDLIFTTRGSRLQLTTEFAGIGGDTEYVRFESRNAFYIPTFKAGEQVISLLARLGTFWEFSNKRTPFFDRYFLGGPDSLRGFEFRDVGPRMENPSYPGASEPVGGNSYGFASIEYSVKVAKPLRLAVFYDWGFVNPSDFSFNPRGYNDNWGVGIRLLVLGNPLRLDFGIPLTTTEYYDATGTRLIYTNKQGNQFNFSFGTRF